jgi:Leucine-rich repeat (LRR) protein
LRRLDIGSCDLDDAGAAVLASIEMPELAHLDLSYNQLTDKGIAQLAASTWPRLKYLDVSVNPIGDRGVAALTRMPWWNTLETIKLVRVELTDAGLATLAQAAPPNVRELSVGPREWYSQDAYDRLRAAVPAGTYL